MSDALYHDVLQQQGFERIGEITYRLPLSIWWNSQKCVQILLMKLGTAVLLKGERSYYLVSTAGRETWARDIAPLHDFLETHFPEIRIGVSLFRDIPAVLAQKEAERELVAEAPTRRLPALETIARLQREFSNAQQNAGAMGRLLHLSSSPGDLLSGYVQQQSRSEQPEVRRIQQALENEQRRFGILKHLQGEYERKGSAAVLTFSISSNLQLVEEQEHFADALGSVVAELTDYDRYQIRQKLQGGRLKIQVADVRQPIIAWIEQWLGGALSPEQLARLGLPSPHREELINAASEHLIVTPDEPIMVDGVIRQAPKHIAAHTLRSILNRLDDTLPAASRDPLDGSTPDSMPLRIGHRVDTSGVKQGPAMLPMKSLGHTIVSGTTGAGKSFLIRTVIEEASRYTHLKILAIDPRGQFSGLLVPEDRASVLDQYEHFGLRQDEARGFAFEYFAPQSTVAPTLPADLSALSRGRSIVSFKNLDDSERCRLSADILNAAFDTYSTRESDHPRLLIVIDETQLLTRRRVNKSAASSAAESEQALDRIAREGRKHGMALLLGTQTIKDFSYELASLRQLAATKIFLRNSDREIEYAADLLPDSRALVHLANAMAVMHNANWGVHRIHVRPPFSKVCELSEEQLRHVLNRHTQNDAPLSAAAKSLLAIITTHASSSTTPMNLTQLAVEARLTSRRKLHELITELEMARHIRTHRLSDRGNPRVVEPIRSSL